MQISTSYSHPRNKRPLDSASLEAPLILLRVPFSYTSYLPPRAAVLKGPIDQPDGVFWLDITHQKDKIWDQPHLQNPKIDGYPDQVSTCIALGASGASNEPQESSE